MTACAGWLAPGGRWSRLREAKQSPCISCLCEFLSFPHFAASRSYNDRVHSLVMRRVLKIQASLTDKGAHTAHPRATGLAL